MTANGASNGHSADLIGVFPEAHMPLVEADPELHGIIEDEKRRQWCVLSLECSGACSFSVQFQIGEA